MLGGPCQRGEAVRTGAYEALIRAGLKVRNPASNPVYSLPIPDVPIPGCWSSGRMNIWQRLDVRSHEPVGNAFAVQHFHGRVSYASGGWSVGGGRIALVLLETSGNIWMMSQSSVR